MANFIFTARRMLILGLISLLTAALLMTGCNISQKTGDAGQTTTKAANTGGLDSVAAAALAYKDAKGVFEEAVFYRMIPTKSEKSTTMLLDSNWQKNDRSAAWTIWYADATGEDWMIYTIEGQKVTERDIGTRDFNPMTMPAEWPREALTISMQAAAAAAAEQGANLTNVSWVEYSCDAYNSKAVWLFDSYDVTKSGSTLNYRIYVDAVSGQVLAARNDRNEDMVLPIDLDALEETRAEDHQADVLEFFSFIIKGDPVWSVRQLSFNLCPDEASGQMWLTNFESIDSLEVVSIEPNRLAEWTDDWENYKVTLKISTKATPDQFGWENGQNVRWISIIPQGAGAWKVDEIATNP